MHREDGVSLIELLTTLALASVLVAFSALALRHYWFVQSLEKASDQVVTELRAAQQRVNAESHPVVYGVRFDPGSATWGVVQYDPRKSSNKCISVGTRSLEGAVEIKAAGFTGGGDAETSCSSALGADNEFAFFYARGSATPGSVTVESQQTGGTKVVDVAGVTGRVEAQ
jgi:prepilin-type N-terminal cleavage/methylation domain-containing protein